jgi:hypothetical protein
LGAECRKRFYGNGVSAVSGLDSLQKCECNVRIFNARAKEYAGSDKLK